jgi:Ran GTPase-activating protein (RanGAP) involved in mRNA processing and transport
MKPILMEGQNSARLAHLGISCGLPLILKMLARVRTVTDLDLTDNCLTENSVQYLVPFVKDPELSILLFHLDDNPIGGSGMRDLIDALQESRTLEDFSISNTGCTPLVGRAIADMISGCTGLQKLNISNCRLRQSAIEIAAALPSSFTIERIDMARNELFYGQRRFALQFGLNAAKCATLTRIDLSQNAITSDMAVALLRGLADAPKLHRLDLSRNSIDEPAGRGIANFVTRSNSIRTLNISYNPILNVILNKQNGQRKLEDDTKAPGGSGKDSKPKAYVPGAYIIAAALPKVINLKVIKMEGLVVDALEWQQKIQPVGDRPTIAWRSMDAICPARRNVRLGSDSAPQTARRSKT